MPFFVREKKFYTSFLKLTLVIALQNFIAFAVNLADNVMIGDYSQTALDGIALVNQIQFLLQMLVLGVSEGMSVITSRFWGKRDPASIRKTVSAASAVALGVALILFTAVTVFPTEILSLLSNDSAVVETGARYMAIVSFSYVFFALSSVLIASMRSVENALIGFIISLVALFVNIGLNYVLIFGKLGFPVLGERGAAIATLFSRIVELAIILCYVLFSDKKVRLKIKDFFSLEREVFSQYFKVSTSVILSNGSWGLAMFLQTAVIGHLDGPAISANAISATVFQVVTVLIYASAAASGVLLGKFLGEMSSSGEISVPAVKQYSRTFQVLYLVFGLFTSALLFFSADAVISLFGKITPEAKALARDFISVLSVTVIGTSYQMSVLTGIVRGGGDTRFVFRNDLIFMWGIVLPASFLAAFVFDLSPLIVFAVLKSDQILKCAVAVIKVNCTTNWLKKI